MTLRDIGQLENATQRLEDAVSILTEKVEDIGTLCALQSEIFFFLDALLMMSRQCRKESKRILTAVVLGFAVVPLRRWTVLIGQRSLFARSQRCPFIELFL
jgi:hypothetical protein